MQFPSRKSIQMKPSKTLPVIVLTGLVIGGLLPGPRALAEEKLVIKPPLQRQLEALVLPEVRFSDAELMDALHYLQRKAQAAPQKPVRVPFVVHLPADFEPRSELTLDLKSIPLWSALGHLCGQAGVEFSIERGSVTIRPLGMAKTTVRTEIPAPAEPSSGRGLTGPLGKPAQPMMTGRNIHRAIHGELQPEKSGSGVHRNLNGWPIAVDPRGKLSMNCVDLEKCKAKCCEDGACGCHCCTCHNMKVDK